MQPGFDAVAREYDAVFSHTAVGSLLRKRVQAVLGDLLIGRFGDFEIENPNIRILELNCGTGEDAIWFAQKGWNVLATDVSVEMVAVARVKADIQLSGSSIIGRKPRFQVCSFADLGQLPEGNFDLIFSNFGGLNCVSPKELEKLGEVIFQKLKPGGKFVAVVMGRFCCWETVYFLLKIKPKEAFRRFSRKAVAAKLDVETTIPTWYYAPSEFQKLLCNSQPSTVEPEPLTVTPIGLWLPPSYLNPFFEKRPRILRLLNLLESKTAPSWLTFAADHFLICLQKNREREGG